MNILIVPSIYPSNEDTQKGIFIHEQTKTLKSNGFNPIVVSCKSVNKITLNHNKIKKYYLDDILIYDRWTVAGQSGLVRAAQHEQTLHPALPEFGHTEISNVVAQGVL